jgi:hypothetical protein
VATDATASAIAAAVVVSTVRFIHTSPALIQSDHRPGYVGSSREALESVVMAITRMLFPPGGKILF